MAFVKGSLGEEGKVKEYTDGLEGRVDSAFKEAESNGSKIKEQKATIANSNYYEGSRNYNWCLINEFTKTCEINIFMGRGSGVSGNAWYDMLILPVKPPVDLYFDGWLEPGTDNGIQVMAKFKLDVNGKLWYILKENYGNAHGIRGHLFFNYK